MTWNFSAWSIRNPIPPILLFIVLMVLGLMSFSKLPVTRFPNIDVPIVSVSVNDPGVAPSELETQVTKRVEDAVANISGVKNVTSTITEGNSQTMVEFRLEVETQTAVNDVKDAIERIRADLPATSDQPIVSRVDVEGQAIVTYAVSAPAMTIEELSWFVDDTVIRRLQGLKGVARVDRYGGVTREIKVELEPDRLNALGVMASDVNRALRAANVDLTGGSGDFGSRDQTIRTLGGARTIEDLSALEIPLSGGRKVRLSDIATVTDAWSEPKSYARSNDQTVVSFGVFRGKGESDVEVNARVETAVAGLVGDHPGIGIAKVDNSVTYTEGNYESAMEMLLEGAALSVIVVLLFLRDIRATIVAATALPLSIIPTFWALDMMGFSLNLVSLLGITLVVGILVDDAIVEIENIVRHVKMGKSPYRAALEAADEIGLAVIAISATIIAVFAPVSFMGGIAGQYFKQFGLTVAVAVFFSLLVARLITPMMAAYFMRGSGHVEPKAGSIMRGYLSILRGTLRFRWLTLIFGVALFAVSIYAIRFLPSGFIPREDASRIVFSLELPPGSLLDDTRATTDEVTRIMREVPQVENVYVVGGASPQGVMETRRATVVADLQHKSERDVPQHEIEEILLAQSRGHSGPARLFRQRPRRAADGVRRDGHRRRGARRAGAQDPERDDGDRQVPRRDVQRGSGQARSHHRTRFRPAGRTRHLDGNSVGDAARGDDRRYRREPGEIHRRRPPDPDPRPAQRGVQGRSVDRQFAGGSHRNGRLRAARLGGQRPLRAGAFVDRPLQPRTPRRHRRRHGAGRRAQRRARHRLGAAGGRRPWRRAPASRKPAMPR